MQWAEGQNIEDTFGGSEQAMACEILYVTKSIPDLCHFHLSLASLCSKLKTDNNKHLLNLCDS